MNTDEEIVSTGEESSQDEDTLIDQDEEEEMDVEGGSSPKPKSKSPKKTRKKREKSVEEIYQKKSQLEHILLRPDTYIGSTAHHTQELYLLNERKRFQKRVITYVPGLFKIFDEILVNAADNKQRDPKQSYIKVTVDMKRNFVSIENDGRGIPVVIHKKEKIYVPELIFGHLLTSSNYDDSERKTTGGRNGYGAKLCNIFSTEFIVETATRRNKKKFRQVFRNNMREKDEPVIERLVEGEKDFTRISFYPDLEKFGMETFDENIVSLFEKRVYDIAGTTAGIDVYFNDQKIPISNFQEYCELYFDDDNISENMVYKKINKNWEIAVTNSEGQFEQISFVNSINTIRGGTHVKYIADQIVEHIAAIVKKKNKYKKILGSSGRAIRSNRIKNHLFLFVNCLIENPAFDSQTKETLITKETDFGSTATVPMAFSKRVGEIGLVENVLAWINYNEKRKILKAAGSAGKKRKIIGIANFDDANKAGTRESYKCTLIVTEGLSARTFAISGLSVAGRDYFGVFPLRGKLLNVRGASSKKVTANAEISALSKILGLKPGKVYDDTQSLRYGHLMIMTDQDVDGSHIKGLVINYIHYFWPSLLQVPGFLREFITPIVKITKGPRNTIPFFTLPEFDDYIKENGIKGWKVKYYKGLGTSSASEAMEYFENIKDHRIDFKYLGKEDDESIELAFSKTKISERKKWLRNVGNVFVDHNKKELQIKDFVHKELILYSDYNNKRSIPSVFDGLKPGQRKILFGCFKRSSNSPIKVEQLSGYISQHTAYHHGEASLQGAIINMAQDYTGSNNINLLYPDGQFGTRVEMGRDSAAARYIHTYLPDTTKHIYIDSDSSVLNFLEEDGLRIEPDHYMPIVPMVLINGAEGIGTGFSTMIPNHNPFEIIDLIRERLLIGEEAYFAKERQDLVPYYSGFKGKIYPDPQKPQSYICEGVIEEDEYGRLIITEIPLHSKYSSFSSYKEFLESLTAEAIRKKKKGEQPKKKSGGRGRPQKSSTETKSFQIEDFEDHSTHVSPHFIVMLDEENLRLAKEIGLYEVFKLRSRINKTNMTLFNSDDVLVKYKTSLDIFDEYFRARLDLYHKRKEAEIAARSREIEILRNKERFIKMIIDGELVVYQKRKRELEDELARLGFMTISSSDDSEGGDYNYLLSMKIWSLTHEKFSKLQSKRSKLERLLEEYRNKPVSEIWIEELDSLVSALHKEEEKKRKKIESMMKTAKRQNLRKSTLAAKRRKRRIEKRKSQALRRSSDAARPVPVGK